MQRVAGEGGGGRVGGIPSRILHRRSYMSAHVLLILLNELGEKIRCAALTNILSVFPNGFNKIQ